MTKIIGSKDVQIVLKENLNLDHKSSVLGVVLLFQVFNPRF